MYTKNNVYIYINSSSSSSRSDKKNKTRSRARTSRSTERNVAKRVDWSVMRGYRRCTCARRRRTDGGHRSYVRSGSAVRVPARKARSSDRPTRYVYLASISIHLCLPSIFDLTIMSCLHLSIDNHYHNLLRDHF